jgi:hypothetical protein
MPATGLLFINKTAQSESLSRSQRKERHQIYRHVQPKNRGQKRKRNRKGRESSISTATATPDVEELSDYASESSSSSAIIVKKEPAVDYVGTGVAVELERALSSGPHLQLSEKRSLTNLITNNATEPFDVFSVPLTSENLALLQYFEYVSNPKTWYPKSRMASNQLAPPQVLLSILQSCLENEMSTRTLLASMATQMLFLEGITPVKNNAALLQEAMVSVRKYIKKAPGPDERLILGIVLLAYAEVHRANSKAARVHILAVKNLVDRLGGIKTMAPYLQWWIAAVDELTTIDLLPSKPVFTPEEVDPGMSNFEYGGTKPLDLGQTILHGLCDPLARIMLELRAVRPTLDLAFSTTFTGEFQGPSDLERWVHTRLWSIRTRLLALDPTDKLSDSVRLAALVWTYMIAPPGRRRSMHVMAAKLRMAMESVVLAGWTASLDLYYWVLIIGSIGSEKNIEDRDWFNHGILRLSAETKAIKSRLTLTVESIEEKLERVLYLQSVHGLVLNELVRDLVFARISYASASP